MAGYAGGAWYIIERQNSRIPLGSGGGGGGGDTAQATAFVARLDGSQNATHTTAYKTLINGLVNDASGIWACLDVLCVFATNDTTNALLNLVSTSFSPVATGLNVTFTPDGGYQGDLVSNDLINTNYNPTTASGLYVQNDAHLSVWNNTNSITGRPLIGSTDTTVDNSIYCFTDNKIYGRINDTPSSGGTVPAGPDYRGLIVTTRTGASAQNIYKIKSSSLEDLSPTPVSSHALANLNFYVCGNNQNGSATGQQVHQVMAYSIGKSLSSTQALALYTWLDGYLVTIAGIAY